MRGIGCGWSVAVCTCALLASSTAFAEISIGGGAEYFRWKETTSPTVKETGLRWVLDLTWNQSRAPGVSVAYNVKTYVGKVDYDGALLASGTLVSGDTHYRGLQNELQVLYRNVSGLDGVLAFGWDHWKRDLTAAQEETYNVLYARLGVAHAVPAPATSGVIASAGAKFPLYVRENAHLTDVGFTSNPRLRPRGDFSFYGTLGYRFTPRWDVIAYYDSYRFKESDIVTVTDSTGVFGFRQPRSRQDLVGVKLQHNF